MEKYSCSLPLCDVGNTFTVKRRGAVYRLETPVTFAGVHQQQQAFYLLADLLQVFYPP